MTGEKVNWRILIEDEAWNSDTTPNLPEMNEDDAPAFRILPSRWLWIGLMACTIIATVIVLWLWQQAQVGLQAMEADLETTLALETATGSHSPGFPITLVDMDLHGNRALVRLSLDASTFGRLSEENRVYRRIGTEWMRSTPTQELWGPEAQLESKYFEFRYRTIDAPAVMSAAVKLDAFYQDLWDSLYSADIETGDKYVVEVLASRTTKRSMFPNGQRMIALASPQLHKLPAALAHSEFIYQAVVLDVIKIETDQILSADLSTWHWQPLQAGLQLWLVWESEAPLSAWKNALVNWFLESQQSLPEDYHSYCRLYHVWQLTPDDHGLPFVCTSVDSLLTRGEMPQALHQLSAPAQLQTEMDESDLTRHQRPQSLQGQSIAMATLFDYAANSYGKERIPVLLGSLNEHTTWDSLVPAIFEISAREFEDGWRQFMNELGVSHVQE